MKYIDVINNTDFYTSEFSSPSVPRMSVSMNTVTTEQINTIAQTYLTNAQNYADTYKAQVAQKEYNIDMMKKGICADEEVGLAIIDLVENTYTANVKADNYFAIAMENNNLISRDGITNTFSKIKLLADELYRLTDEDKLQLGNEEAEDAINALMLNAVTYDTKAIKVNISSVKETYTEPLTFINTKPNATNNNIVLSAFVKVEEETKKIFTIKFVNNSWVLAEVTELDGVETENNIATITEDIATIAKGGTVELTFTPIAVQE